MRWSVALMATKLGVRLRGRRWKNALPTLNEHRLIKVVFLPDGEDPDSLIRSQGKAGFSALH